jgi:hypothetical protein
LLNFKIEKTNKKCVDSFDIPEINERKEISNKTGLNQGLILKPGEKISNYLAKVAKEKFMFILKQRFTMHGNTWVL